MRLAARGLLLLVLPLLVPRPAAAAAAGGGASLPLFFPHDTHYLPPAVLDRAVAYPSSLAGPWREFFRRLESGAPFTLAVVGGSVSCGHKGCGRLCWSPSELGRSPPPPKLPECRLTPTYENTFSRLVFDALNASAPHPGNRYVNGCVPATGAAFFASCVQYRVPLGGSDLVLLELAVNGDSSDAHYAAVEALVRRLLAAGADSAGGPGSGSGSGSEGGSGGGSEGQKRAPALLFVDWNRNWPGMTSSSIVNGTMTSALGRLGPDEPASSNNTGRAGWFASGAGGSSSAFVASAYDVPRVSLRDALVGPDAAGVLGLRYEDFAADWSHPNCLGHRYIAAAILHFVSQASVRVFSAPHLRGAPAEPPAAAAARLLSLPPLTPGNDRERSATTCFFGPQLRPLAAEKANATAGSGEDGGKWAWDDSDPAKLGWAAARAGQRLVLALRRPAGAAGFVVSFLRSRDHGLAEVACAPAACACAPSALQGFVDGPGHLFVAATVPFASSATVPVDCEVTLTALRHEPSGQEGFKLAALIISADISAQSYGPDMKELRGSFSGLA